VEKGRADAGTVPETAALWPDLAGNIGFDAPGYHRAREDFGEQEKLEASSMDGSREAVTARWRPRARLGEVELAAEQLRAQVVARRRWLQ
jgi:hypothetical protein